MTRRAVMKWGFFVVLIAMNQSVARVLSKDEAMNILIQKYIADFRQGNEFSPSDDVSALIRNFHPDPEALFALRKELSAGSKSVRENIVQLLGAIGLACDPPTPARRSVIRDHGVIKALLVEGYAKIDSARYAAAKMLHTQCTPGDLAAFNDLFLQSLHSGSTDYLLLIAKAKTAGTLDAVEKIVKLPSFQEQENNVRIVRIAQAALGNTAMEQAYLDATVLAEKTAPPAPKNRFYDVGAARDGAAVADSLGQLGYIGTQRCLLLACAFLRSPMKRYVVNISEHMIRNDALRAIAFNFPDERVLYQPRTVADWAAAENFCTENLGAVFDGPTPDLPAARIYPLPVRGRLSAS